MIPPQQLKMVKTFKTNLDDECECGFVYVSTMSVGDRTVHQIHGTGLVRRCRLCCVVLCCAGIKLWFSSRIVCALNH